MRAEPHGRVPSFDNCNLTVCWTGTKVMFAHHASVPVQQTVIRLLFTVT
jgi:hypothetical protein